MASWSYALSRILILLAVIADTFEIPCFLSLSRSVRSAPGPLGGTRFLGAVLHPGRLDPLLSPVRSVRGSCAPVVCVDSPAKPLSVPVWEPGGGEDGPPKPGGPPGRYSMTSV